MSIVKDDMIKLDKDKLQAREDSFKLLTEMAHIGSWELDLVTNYLILTKQIYKLYGLNQHTKPSYELFLSTLPPKDAQKARDTLKNAIETGEMITFKSKIEKTDKNYENILIAGRVVYDSNNKPLKFVGSIQNTTEYMNSKRELAKFEKLVRFSPHEIYIVDYNSLNFLYVNQGAIEAVGYTKEEFLQMSLLDINLNLTIKHVDALKQKALNKNLITNRAIHQKKDGSTYYVQSSIHELNYHNKNAFVIFDTDITTQVTSEKLLEEQTLRFNYQANHDSLTKLPNRMLFDDRLEQTISHSLRNDEQFALFFIDLDHFKKINDSLGHGMGDEVLKVGAKRLSSVLRKEDTLARLGGDEFTVILRDTKGAQSAITVAKKIISIVEKPIELKEHTLFVTSSIGISMFPDDTDIKEDLIKFADTAMYKAKDEGRNNFQFYFSNLTESALEKVTLENSLRIAIKEDQFEVYFQPQYNAVDESITGMEALVRWEHPELGRVSPMKFIPLAEENGMIVDLDRIVMTKAMRQFSRWYKDGLNPGKLALNLAMRQLNEKDFIPVLLDTMKSTEFQPLWLELEVTEGQIMDNPKRSIEKLKEISRMGIHIAVDDFGTGYSSLAYLKKLPLDKLKIDREFIKDIHYDNGDDKAITKAIITLAKSLNLKIVAEGVEEKGQKDFLLEHGCEHIQGFYYSKPIPSHEMDELLKRQKV